METRIIELAEMRPVAHPESQEAEVLLARSQQEARTRRMPARITHLYQRKRPAPGALTWAHVQQGLQQMARLLR